jgi:hypothetical protein
MGGARGAPARAWRSEGARVEVIELKTVERIPPSPWGDHVVQAQVYGLLLDLAGFDCSSLKLSIWYVRRGWELARAASARGN